MWALKWSESDLEVFVLSDVALCSENVVWEHESIMSMATSVTTLSLFYLGILLITNNETPNINKN